ncbi:MAG: hypothetical protein HY548_06285, partial [Elusimicrobia bacterium]|nr:hypothetical protein [Elusimicrobiota bacterium]
LYSTFRTLTEPLSFFFILAGLLFWDKEKRGSAGVCFSLSLLARETFFVVPLAVFGWDVLTRKKTAWRSVYGLAGIFLPFLLWLMYVKARLPPETSVMKNALEATFTGAGRINWPFFGICLESFYGLGRMTSRTDLLRTLSLSAAAIVLILMNFAWLLRRPGFWSALGFALAFFTSVVGGNIWDYHASSARVMIPLFFFTHALLAEELSAPLPSD